MSIIQAWAASHAGAPFELTRLDLGELPSTDVEIAVEHCGLCSADDSMWRSAAGGTQFPFVPGHEIVGRITALGSSVPPGRIGQRVGVGWLNGSCMQCWSCLGGAQHLCGSRRRTVFAQPGGFASHVRSHSAWAVPLPERLNAATAGPLFCAGLAVFRPLADLPVLPTWRVGVVGMGGLGHLALKFLSAWGCETVVFSSHENKAADALRMGASLVVATNENSASASLKGTFDLLLVTSRSINWPHMGSMLAPQGRVHVLATLAEPLQVASSFLTGGDRTIGGSIVGSPATAKLMLDFAARHRIEPDVERMPMSRINEALTKFGSGDVHYRLVLDADF